jgi:tripartite-type tricarboxylate transporter receptor subunit TctC
MLRRTILRLGTGLLALAFAFPAFAQPYPQRLIHLINPYAAGGSLDTLARIIAPRLAAGLGQPVIVENRAGAGGNIGSAFVAKSAPDGYTLVMGSSATHGINVTLYGAKLPFDAVKDFAPVAVAAIQKNVLVVNPSVPAKSVQELIAYGKANPGKLTFGSAGTGTSQHLSGELFRALSGVDMVHVPYKGSALAMTDLLSGQVSMLFVDIPTALQHIRSGKLHPLGVTSAERAPALPDLPTIAEQGMAGFDVRAWYGVLAPAGTPKEIVDRLNAEIMKILAQSEVKERLAAIGMEAMTITAEQSGVFIRNDIARWAKIVKDSGAHLE